jgi:hypothetical protein
MRLVSTVLLTLIFACLLRAQAPIGFGPGTLSPGLLDKFDWYAATASGCAAGAKEMCVGSRPNGDTMYFSGWFANATGLPVPGGLPIVGTLNDFSSKTCSGNLMVIQLAAFDWAARNASKIAEVNCMTSYGAAPGSSDAPAGWKGHCTSGDSYGPGDCGWKSRPPFVRGGNLYLMVERQISAGTLSVHDATIIVSADKGLTWKNPYTVANGGAASVTGDAPQCGAAAGGAANPCTDTAYLDIAHSSMMWKGLPLLLSAWQPVEYGQDGSSLPTVNDGCNPATYTCFTGGEAEGTIARVPNASIMDISTWQYYTCPAITDTYRCPGSDPASWTSTLADRTQVLRYLPGTMSFYNAAYVKEFKSYILSGYYIFPNSSRGSPFFTAPTIQGPWTLIMASNAMDAGFASPMLSLSTVVSGNPPQIKLTTASDETSQVGSGTPFFYQWDLVLGRTMQGGDNPRYSNVSGVVQNAGYVFSDSHAPGTIPRRDLDWAFDFYDHGGLSTATGIGGFHEIANGSAFLLPCHSSVCGWNPGRGATLETFGATIGDGYGANLATMAHELPQTIATAAAHTNTGGLTPQNAPTAMQGNGTFTVAGVFRRNGAGFAQEPLWSTGDFSATNSMVDLSYDNPTGGSLELGWGLGNRWRYDSGFTMTAGNWYFIVCTVQATGSTPTAHMWMGIGGALVDKIAGVSRTSSSGSPTQTPNVVAAPLVLAQTFNGHEVYASYAGLFVYSRALGQAEVGLMYQTVKAKMTARGVTVQ